jgi:mono/diheme cytochrome c family protein
MRGASWLVCLTIAALALPYALFGADQPETQDGFPAEELFVHRVLPVFQDRCFACHGADPQDVRGAFNMLTRDGLLQGGESEEPAIVPGQPEESPLYQAVRWELLEMPPKENDRLSDEQVGSIREWIAAGAPWPTEERIAELRRTTAEKWNREAGVTVRTSGGLSQEWTGRRYDPDQLWAYQPLRRVSPERVHSADNPVDLLLEERMRELEIDPAPPADRRTLIRRATFDLLGLPPTPDEVDAFVNDPAPDDEAFARLVERLLASPHYGEQWGRHWLDVVRYADSSGYANDYERGNAWRYRDYVIRAFNADKPYDEFIREQIAGDEIDPTDPEMLVAVGFLRMGPWELTGMEVPKVARQRFLDDVTDAVGQVFLAHMLQCARCHDHKFDPVPTRDYYAIQAAFATTQLAERPTGFLDVENRSRFDEQKYLRQRMEHYRQTLRELEAKQTLEAAREWYAEQGRDAGPFEAVLGELRQGASDRSVSVSDVRRELMKRDVHPDLIFPRHVGFEPRDYGLERIARKGIQRLQWRLERYEPIALSVYSGKTPVLRSVTTPLRMPDEPLETGQLEETAILTGGDPFSPAEPVRPGTLSVVASVPPSPRRPVPSSIPAGIVGRRKALADWIASEHNPLTARVMVNRIWQWHFGQGIAGNPNNFGATGKRPTHPELLDELAGRFIESGWSIKQMHRLIMNSRAYRRASSHPQPERLEQTDPLGESYAVFQPRRLTAEELRDAMLFVSGELNRELGGIPVRPEMNLEAALQPRQVMGTFAEAWQPSPLPSERHRRSIYALKLRGQTDPFLEVFNAPSPDLSCEQRESSTVTPQVFSLFNSEQSYDRALAFARRLLEAEDALGKSQGPRAESQGERPQPSQRSIINRLFRLALGRPPSAAETAACLEHWERMTARHAKLEFPPPESPSEVVREAVEENTGERFTFTEPLEFYADFVPDLKPSAASPELRGLAEVCLVLFNTNEFAYVY